MRGVFSKLPADTLAAALAPISDQSSRLDWAVELQSGPLRYPYYDEDEPANLLAFLHGECEPARPFHIMHWFSAGFLPRHANALVFDEWSYYLGFSSQVISPLELAKVLGAGGMSPQDNLFDVIARYGMIYLMRVDSGWWEAYCADGDVLQRLIDGWDGIVIDSARWKFGLRTYPPDDATT